MDKPGIAGGSRGDVPGGASREGLSGVLREGSIGSDYEGSLPDHLHAVLASGRGISKGALAGKIKKGGKGQGGKQLTLAVGLGDGQNFAVAGQAVVKINSAGGSDKLTDHLPWAYARLYIGDRLFVQAGLHLYSPQYVRPTQIDSSGGDTSRLPGYQSYLQDTTVTLKKSYYTDIPILVYYRVAGPFYVGAGLQYSRLWGGTTEWTAELHPSNGIGANLLANEDLAVELKNEPAANAYVKNSDWRFLLDAVFSWKRLTLGLRYQQALSSYTTWNTSGSKPKNSALSVYGSYDILRKRLKK